MSSGFVSGGTTDAPIERSDEWLAAEAELEAQRACKAAEARQSDGRSLYETLEANKIAKQEAFEEANKLKNQFLSLDEDDIEFLDSVLESTRAEEDRVERETKEGLDAFRKQQEEADKKLRESEGRAALGVASPTAEEEQWIAGGRKRKRKAEKEVLKGIKIRRASSTVEDSKAASPPAPSTGKQNAKHADDTGSAKLSQEKRTESNPQTKPAETIAPLKPPAAPSKAGLGLVDYGSDEDDDW